MVAIPAVAGLSTILGIFYENLDFDSRSVLQVW